MKAGNTATRIIVSVFAIPIIIAVSYFGKAYFLLFVCVIALAAFREFCQIAEKKNSFVNKPFGYAAVIYFILNSYYPIWDVYSSVLVLIFILLLVELFRKNNSAVSNLSATSLGVFYVGFFMSSLIGIREMFIDPFYQRGGYLIISIMAAIWICDSAAYFGGTALGKHKLFRRVSPNKSWEGAIFGFVFAILTMLLAKEIVLQFLPFNLIILIGLTVGVFGQIGDLIESLFKRDAHIKDSSSIIPGHGGVLDRFDSLLYSAPIIFLLLKYFY